MKILKKIFRKNNLHKLLKNLLREHKNINIVQIGANDGRINDPIYDFVMKNKSRTRILLVEPQANILPFLEENYAEHPNHYIANNAIGPNQELLFYRLRPEYYDIFQTERMKSAPKYRVPSGFASFDKFHVYSRVGGHLPAHIRAEEAVEEIHIKCSDLKSIIDNVPELEGRIDFIQIDAEGMDDMVIYSSNIDLFTPKLINFEHKHLKSESKDRLFNYLMRNGYTLSSFNKSDTVAVRK